MQVKLIDAPGVKGGKAYALCDENGEVIGQQIAVTITNGVGETPTIAVTFLVDGQQIRFAD